MVKIVFNGNDGKDKVKITKMGEALTALKLMKEVGSFMYDGEDWAYNDSFLVVPVSKSCYYELHIQGDTMT